MEEQLKYYSEKCSILEQIDEKNQEIIKLQQQEIDSLKNELVLSKELNTKYEQLSSVYKALNQLKITAAQSIIDWARTPV